MPDYKLYPDNNLSIGFTTRGCFRHCSFCVNQNYDRVNLWSPLEEFYDPDQKYISLLDDNIFGYSGWRDIFEQLRATGKRFEFKQGLDERLLTPEKCEVLFSSKIYGQIKFAFDNIADRDLIISKLNLIREYTDKRLTFYVFTGFDREGRYTRDFWYQDILDLMTRIEILGSYGCYPYIMRHINYKNSPYREIYVNIARWINQPSFFVKESIAEFCVTTEKTGQMSMTRAFKRFLKEHPDFEPLMYKHYFRKWDSGERANMVLRT